MNKDISNLAGISSIFDEVFQPLKYATNIDYQWKDNVLWLNVAGCTKDDFETSIEGNTLRMKWETKYGKGDYKVGMPKGTQNISVDVDNGMAVIEFHTEQKNISIEYK